MKKVGPGATGLSGKAEVPKRMGNCPIRRVVCPVLGAVGAMEGSREAETVSLLRINVVIAVGCGGGGDGGRQVRRFF